MLVEGACLPEGNRQRSRVTAADTDSVLAALFIVGCPEDMDAPERELTVDWLGAK